MHVEVSAPGRLCLFGEHQDFLELSVIATAIDLSINITGTPRSDRQFCVHLPNLKGTNEAPHTSFECSAELTHRHERDYLHSAVNVLRKNGLCLDCGYDCEVNGTIPMNAGTSSSSAFTVAWTTFLLHTQNGEMSHNAEDIAHLAYLAEVEEFGEPGGKMDHYTSAVGNLLYIDCVEPIKVKRLPTKLDGFVLGNTGVAKPTTSTLGDSRDRTKEGVEDLKKCLPGFDLKTTPREEVEPLIEKMDKDVARLLRAHLINRDLCQEALEMLSADSLDQERLGAMLYEHQEQLRDGIRVSCPQLDVLVDAACEAGALGGKLNGSGCGGAMFAYAPGKQDEVAEAINRAGGTAYKVNVRGGVSVTKTD